MADAKPTKIFLLAGEPSGDVIGARLMQALHRQQNGLALDFFGVGGPRMQAQGLDSLFPMDELSLMGFTEVLPHVPKLLRRLAQTRKEILRRQPAMALTIDSPAFSLRLQKRLDGQALRRVHYVAPQVWAWRPGRAATLGTKIDHLLALLPFEPRFFRKYGLACSFVGHPIIEEAGRKGNGALFRKRYEQPADAPIVCLLPGSRLGEIRQHMPVMKAVAHKLAQRFPRLRLILPTLPSLKPVLRPMIEDWSIQPLILDERADRFDAYAASWIAIAASGTVTLELALANLPHITIYRTGKVTAWLARRMINVDHVNLVNLILNRPVVPEWLQEDCTPERITTSAMHLIEDEEYRESQREQLGEVIAMLRGSDDSPPSEQAARRVLDLLGQSG
ncbi:MAG: lipid-A-disaccharide synthase [Alphaproteobacteria bacterium]